MRYVFISFFFLVFLFSCEKVEDKGYFKKNVNTKMQKSTKKVKIEAKRKHFDIRKLKRNKVAIDINKKLNKSIKKDRVVNIKFVDSDNDGVHDLLDKCPNQKEVKNGIKDNDGCPD